jgi:magnesium transporter
VPTAPAASGSGIVNCVAYEHGARLGDVELGVVPDALQRPDTFVWIGLVDPDEWLLRVVQQQFGLHDLAIEDALNGHQRPKLERYEDCLFVVLRTVQLAGDPRHVEYGETHLFVGRNYVLTVRHGSQVSHVGLRARCEAVPKLLAQGPAFVLYALMDFVVDQYLPVVETLDDELDLVEAEIFSERFGRGTTERIYRLKRDVLSVKRTLTPLIDVCNRLMRFDNDLIHEETRPYFRDVYDHVMRLTEMLDNLSQMVSTALEANISLVSMSQTEGTKRLAAWAAIIAVPTMVAGIYGMNFTFMPELTWRWGYPLSLGIMGAACTGLFVWFRRLRWL